MKFSTWFLGVLAFSAHFIGPEASDSPRARLEGLGAGTGGSGNQLSQRPKYAYVTLLYGGFLLGSRVLGQSLKEADPDRDRVALCTETVSDDTKKVLKADGWVIKPISNIHSPYEGKSKRGNYFFGAYSKIHVWNMTEYERVVYLDSDTLVLSNISQLFNCGSFCAAFRHSDLFNSGVMVIQPSRDVFKDMIKEVPELKSYDVGDQGFFNNYFKELVYGPFFNWSNTTRQQQPMRLPAGLNADVGMYYINSRWLIPQKDIKIIHYTMGPTKPWIWWTHFLFELNCYWTDVRKRLPQYPYHHDIYEPAYLPILWAPYPILIFLYAGLQFLQCSLHKWSCSSQPLKLFSTVNSRYSHFLPLPFLFLSYYLAYRIVPTNMIPCQGEYVFWLWSNFLLAIFMGLYCYLCHVTGKRYDSNGHNGVFRKKLQTLVCYIAFVASYIPLKVVVPASSPFYRRVNVFFTLLAIHIVVSQITGYWIISVWTKAKNGTAALNPKANGSLASSLSLWEVHRKV